MIRLTGLFFLVLIAGMHSALALPRGGLPPEPPSAPATVIGNITITWFESPSALMSFLQESTGGGLWANVSAPNSNGSVTLSRSPGVYYYRVKEIGLTDDPYEPLDYTLYSSQITVTVISNVVPVFDEVEVQIGYEFIFTAGDINADGRQDLYLERITGDMDNGVLSQAIITAQADGSYARFLPTAAQLQTAQAWVSLDVDYSIGDFNMDEVGDLTINGLPNNARQHIIVSSGEYFDRNAIAVIPMTDAIERFYGDLAASVTDAGHFDDAELAQVPGYNIRIMGQVTTCVYYYWFPFCYSEVFTLFDEDISLADLGLNNFLGATSSKSTTASASKISSQRTQLESAAIYYSSNVYNAAAVTMSDHNVSTLAGTTAQKSTALTMMASVLALTDQSDPEVLVCVYWCGWTRYYYANATITFSWVDVWTPIMMGPAFDESAYSKGAYDIAQILDKADDAITDDDWLTVGSILSATVAIPMPGDWPRDDVDKKTKKRFRILWQVWAFVEISEHLRQYIWMNHYTGDRGWYAIHDTKRFINLRIPKGGPVYFTHLAWWNPRHIEKVLALCGEPIVGYYKVRLTSLQISPPPALPVPPRTCEPGTIQAGTHHPGGGPQRVGISPVIPAGPMRRHAIVDGYDSY